jgi:hypothetical protein
MRLAHSTEQDVPQIQEWIKLDPHHKEHDPKWWLTGNGLLSFVLLDDKGPLCYVRLDKEDNMVRLHTQFGPREEVNKIRLIKGMLHCIPIVISFSMGQRDVTGVVFSSVSESLIFFMEKKYDFKSVGNDDYVLDFEAK